MNKTNFDRYLEEQLKDEGFAERFRRAGRAWDVALQVAALRKDARLSQKITTHATSPSGRRRQT